MSNVIADMSACTAIEIPNLCGDPLYTIVNCSPFNSFESGAFDHLDNFLLGHLDLVVRLNGVAVGEFAAVGDGAT